MNIPPPMFAEIYNACFDGPREIASVVVESVYVQHKIRRLICYENLTSMKVRWTLDAIFQLESYSDGGVCIPPYPNAAVRGIYRKSEEKGFLRLKRARGNMQMFERDWPIFKLYTDDWRNPESVNRYFYNR